MYSTTLARWIEPDPIGPKDSLNLYLMERGNPARFVDPLGLAADDPWQRNAGTEIPGAGGKVTLDNGDTGTIRVFKEATIENKAFIRRGLMQIEFKTDDPKKASCHNAHFIQFVRPYVKDKNGKELKVAYDAEDNNVYRYTGETYVDAMWTGHNPESPYYETHHESNHTDTEISLFDRPTSLIGADYSESGMLADTFLVVDKKVYWHVHWEMHNTPDATRFWSQTYENITGEKTDTLGKLAGDKFLVGYKTPDSTKPPDQQLSNPIYINNVDSLK